MAGEMVPIPPEGRVLMYQDGGLNLQVRLDGQTVWLTQKITDIYATSIDYEAKAPITQTFYATVQNKLHWAAHGHTAAEVIVARADASKPRMGLTTWKN